MHPSKWNLYPLNLNLINYRNYNKNLTNNDL
ncbi:unnamed protein product, partial [marine sediment metagenome]